MKYIVLRGPSGEAAILFPRSFMHRWVAELFAPMPVVSAGFVRKTPEGLECHGRSAGLAIASRPGPDSLLVARALTESDVETAIT
jgi:hypothetical protein